MMATSKVAAQAAADPGMRDPTRWWLGAQEVGPPPCCQGPPPNDFQTASGIVPRATHLNLSHARQAHMHATHDAPALRAASRCCKFSTLALLRRAAAPASSTDMTPHLRSFHVMQALLHDIQQTQLPRMELSLLLQRLLLVAMTSSELQDPVLASFSHAGCSQGLPWLPLQAKVVAAHARGGEAASLVTCLASCNQVSQAGHRDCMDSLTEPLLSSLGPQLCRHCPSACICQLCPDLTLVPLQCRRAEVERCWQSCSSGSHSQHAALESCLSAEHAAALKSSPSEQPQQIADASWPCAGW